MKLKHAMTLSLALVLSLQLRASDLPAPMPEFMDQQQLAKWSADMSAKAQAATATEPPTQFYTGKPYVADAGGYIFKYRTYNPEMARWTSADPSGFPDGANNQFYAPNPTDQLDACGLSVSLIPGGTANPTTAFDNGFKITVTNITVVTNPDITTPQNLFPNQHFALDTTNTNVKVKVLGYSAQKSPDGTGLDLSIALKVPSRYDYTQDLTDTIKNGNYDPNTFFPDLTLPDTAIASNQTTGLPNITPTQAAAEGFGNAPHGDLGRGYFYDTPGGFAEQSSVSTWTAYLYIVEISGQNYTVMGEISYSYTISPE